MLRSRTSLIGAATALLTACGGGAAPRPLPATAPVTVAAPTQPPATASPPRPELRSRKLAADEKLTAAGGATFTASAGWTIEEHPERITLIAPEGDLNTSGAGLFNHAVERRLLELLFDGRAEAKENVAAAVAREAEARAEELARIQREPEPAWFGPLVGAWRAPGLGRIELRVERGKAVLDAGEWKAPVGKKTARDGSAMLIATGGMVAGIELLPREQDGRAVLVLDAGQQQVVFERVPPTGVPAKQK